MGARSTLAVLRNDGRFVLVDGFMVKMRGRLSIILNEGGGAVEHGGWRTKDRTSIEVNARRTYVLLSKPPEDVAYSGTITGKGKSEVLRLKDNLRDLVARRVEADTLSRQADWHVLLGQQDCRITR